MRRRLFWIAAPAVLLGVPTALSGTRIFGRSRRETGGVIALGDSITHGTGLNRRDSYPAQLQALVSGTVWNAGVSGDKAAEARARLGQLLVVHRPRALVVLVGINDAGVFAPATPVPAFVESLSAIVPEARGSEAASLLCSLFPVENAVLAKSNLSADGWAEYDAAVRGVAESMAVPLVDLLQATVGRDGLSLDGLHPNREGSAVIARSVADALIGVGLAGPRRS